MFSIKLLFPLITLLGLVSCENHDGDEQPSIQTPEREVQIYPAPPSGWTGGDKPYNTTGWVGDVMPYFDEGKFHLFFLHDATVKPEGKGFHAIHKFETGNLVDYSYKGEMIPFGEIDEPDFAIGTGSVIKHEEQYYFYFTGHNGSPSFTSNHPRESILCASSSDLDNWEKLPDFKMTAPQGYFDYEFRDPHVFYNEESQNYWMLQSTQYEDSRDAVILRYTSEDPSKEQWKEEAPLYVSSEKEDYLMMECADIFKMGNYWYLFFSENWNEKATHYRIANSPNGPWIKPENDMLDGEFFYAAKTASDGNKRYLFGWTARRSPENDSGNKQWAGNLVVHELLQKEDGTLGVKPPKAVSDLFAYELPLLSTSKIGEVLMTGNNFHLSAAGNYTSSVFEDLEGSRKITSQLSFEKNQGEVGFFFGGETDMEGAYRIVFLPEENKVKAFNGNNNIAITEVSLNLTEGNTYEIEIICSNDICVVYINGERALSNRIYRLQKNHWGVFSHDNEAYFTDLKLNGINP